MSFNFNTKSWISFHSYLPNWYIGENNFFYSGVNGCCDGFDALVGVIGPIPTTTTTSSTSSTSTTSTSTSTTTSTSTSTTTTTSTSSTTTTTTTLCPKAGGLVQEAFFTGYNIISPASTVVSTGSSSAACNAVNYLNSLPLPYTNVVPTYRVVYYQGLFLGSYVYASDLRTDCTPTPDGWYFTGESQAANTVFRVLNGVIVEIVICPTPTTTTTTSSSTSTTTTTSTPPPPTTTTTTTTPPPPPTTTTTTTSCLCYNGAIVEVTTAGLLTWLDCNNAPQSNSYGIGPQGISGCIKPNTWGGTAIVDEELTSYGPCCSITTTTTTTPPPTTTTTTTVLCYNYQNQGPVNWTGDYKVCGGSLLTGQTIAPGDLVCAEQGSIVTNSGVLTQTSACNP